MLRRIMLDDTYAVPMSFEAPLAVGKAAILSFLEVDGQGRTSRSWMAAYISIGKSIRSPALRLTACVWRPGRL